MYVRTSIHACTGIKTRLNLVKLKELLKFLTPRHLLSAQPKKKVGLGILSLQGHVQTVRPSYDGNLRVPTLCHHPQETRPFKGLSTTIIP